MGRSASRSRDNQSGGGGGGGGGGGNSKRWAAQSVWWKLLQPTSDGLRNRQKCGAPI